MKNYISKGFVYSFIHSVHSSLAKPEGYSAAHAEELLAGYSDAEIPADKRVNILAYQLEGFSDLSRLGLSEAEPAFSLYHELETEGLSGNLGVNIFGGGTVNTERCVLTGI